MYRNACAGSDCLAAKGVKYARVNKTVGAVSKVLNVFATHMQAWYTPEDKAVRVKQAAQLRAFIDTQEIPATEPVLIAGDFNTDYVKYPGEVDRLRSALNASIPTLVGDRPFSSDPSANLLVGRDGAAGDCGALYEAAWGPRVNKTYQPSPDRRVATSISWPPQTDNGEPVQPFFSNRDNQTYCPCCPYEWLDFIMYSDRHQKPASQPTLEAFALKAPAPFSVPWSGALQPVPDPPVVGSYMSLTDLSDHFPVFGKFTFDVTSPAIDGTNGCRRDSDCSFHVSAKASCYCDGPGCTWNGTHRNGWDAGASDPVNKNCHYHLVSGFCECHKEMDTNVDLN